MSEVIFLTDGNDLCGFKITGHCSSDGTDEAGKIVCSAVSSAAYMAANTITEIITDKAEIEVNDAFMRCIVKSPSRESVKVLKGLQLHLKELARQYSSNIKIYGGVKHVKA